MYATAQPLAPHSATLAPHSASSPSEFIRHLMTTHGPSVLASVTRMTCDRALAEDIVQETMIRAWRNIDRFDPERDTGMRGWLLRVARNIAVDKFRAKKVRPAEVPESAALRIGVPDPADKVLRAVQVRAALGRLSEAHRAVLRECYFNGNTISETAEILGIPVGTVKSRLSSALRNLRDQLADPAEAA
jgi:RNA polymerase sigma-70 factor (ECF subfamily)